MMDFEWKSSVETVLWCISTFGGQWDISQWNKQQCLPVKTKKRCWRNIRRPAKALLTSIQKLCFQCNRRNSQGKSLQYWPHFKTMVMQIILMLMLFLKWFKRIRSKILLAVTSLPRVKRELNWSKLWFLDSFIKIGSFIWAVDRAKCEIASCSNM